MAVRRKRTDGSARKGSHRFRARLEPRGPRGAWCHVFFPKSASAFLGRRGSVPIRMTVLGRTWRVHALPDGDGGHCFQFNVKLRAETRAEIGDVLEFAIELDTAPRPIELAADFEAALASTPEARAAFDAVSPSHRRAYVRWIDEVKSPAKRVERIEKTLRSLVKWGREREARGREKS